MKKLNTFWLFIIFAFVFYGVIQVLNLDWDIKSILYQYAYFNVLLILFWLSVFI